MLALFAVFLLAVGAAGCGSGSSSSSSGASEATEETGGEGSGDPGKEVSIAMFLVATANTHQQASLKGAEKAVEEGGNASVRAFNGNFDPATQSNQIEDAAASGQYDALLVDSVDGTQTIPAITKALDEGLVVVCGFSICGPNQEEFAKELPVAAQVAANYVIVGEAEGHAVVKGCEERKYDPCKVALFKGIATLAAGKSVVEGIENVLDEHPEIEVVAEAEGEFLAGPSYKAMKPIIQANPDLSGVVAAGDQEIAGAAQAIEESPLKNNKLILVGDGAGEVSTKLVEEGKLYATAILRPFHEGEIEAKSAIAAVRSEPISPDLINSAETPEFPEGYIDESNASNWKPEWAG
jgi:ribose transport system substrate-binding protein